jgi:serine protease inhibitor
MHFSRPRWKVLVPVAASFLAARLLSTPATDQEKLVSANTSFAFHLLQQVTRLQPEANVFISPTSVSAALELAADGAAGETKSEMQHVLRTAGLPSDLLEAAVKNLNKQLAARQNVTLNLANSLWFQQGLHLQPVFADDNREYFQAQLKGVDFSSPKSAKTINAWAAAQTGGKIEEVVQFPFPPQTRLILANVNYPKAQWAEPFKPGQTHRRDFHLPNGRTQSVPMMSREAYFIHEETADFQAVQLPCLGELQMELFLPGTNSSQQKLLAEFAASTNWPGDVQSGFIHEDGSLILPKFKMEFAALLNQPLKALGMTNAFARTANFSGIASGPLFLSEVKQKSYVNMDETGIGSAATTPARATEQAGRFAWPIAFVMLLDRPFLFLITLQPSGTILFVGIVNDPSSG